MLTPWFAAALLFLPQADLARTPSPSFEVRKRMSDLYSRFRDYVRGGVVVPHFEPDGERFWYRDRAGDVQWVDADGKTPATPFEDFEPTPAETGDGRRVEVRDDDLVVVGSDGEEEVLTEGGLPDFGWSLPEGARSPAGPIWLARRADLRDVHHLSLPDYSQGIPELRWVPYIKTGDVFPNTELFLFDLERGSRVRVALGDDPEIYVWIAGWRVDGSEVLLLRLTRDAKQLDLLAADVSTGRTRVILTETRETFVAGLDFAMGGYRSWFTDLGDDRWFIWRSERAGFAHLYLYSFEGRLLKQLTQGEFVVDRVEAIDREHDLLFFSASTEASPYDRQIYRVGLDGTGLLRLTEAPGRHEASFSPSRKVFIDTHSSAVRPPISELRSCAGELLRVLEEASIVGLKALSWSPPEPFVARAADGVTDLHGVLYKPYDFDPQRSYPLIDYIYAGPFLSVVQHSFVGEGNLPNRARALAQMGFVVFMLDARGTPGRGKAFQDVTYGCVGRHEIADHVAVLEQLARDRPYLDRDRVGVVGASWGGYFAVRAMFTAPEVFQVGVSIAPGDLTEAALINEPYMDLPSRNPEGYEFGSVLHGAEDLEGRLLLVHGTSDVNAPFSTTMRIVDALVRANRPHDLVVLPGEDHYFRGPGGNYMWDRALHFLWEHLAPQ